MRATILGVSVLLARIGTAAAQPALTPPSPPAARVQPPEEPLSEATAMALSLGGTVVSWGMVAGAGTLARGSARSTVATAGAIGTLLAPSFGHWYANDGATRGLGLRVLGVGAFATGVVLALANDGDEPVGAEVVLAAGAALYVVGTVDDIATTPRAVRRHNQRAHELAVVPVIRRDRGGLMVTGRF